MLLIQNYVCRSSLSQGLSPQLLRHPLCNPLPLLPINVSSAYLALTSMKVPVLPVFLSQLTTWDPISFHLSRYNFILNFSVSVLNTTKVQYRIFIFVYQLRTAIGVTEESRRSNRWQLKPLSSRYLRAFLKCHLIYFLSPKRGKQFNGISINIGNINTPAISWEHRQLEQCVLSMPLVLFSPWIIFMYNQTSSQWK